MFEILGFTPEKAQEQFGFLMNAFKYAISSVRSGVTTTSLHRSIYEYRNINL